jgi:hypothetical protein
MAMLDTGEMLSILRSTCAVQLALDLARKKEAATHNLGGMRHAFGRHSSSDSAREDLEVSRADQQTRVHSMGHHRQHVVNELPKAVSSRHSTPAAG